jgi:hypothetical protein
MIRLRCPRGPARAGVERFADQDLSPRAGMEGGSGTASTEDPREDKPPGPVTVPTAEPGAEHTAPGEPPAAKLER